MHNDSLLASTNVKNKELALRDIPDFDFWGLRRVLRIDISWEDVDSLNSSLELVMHLTVVYERQDPKRNYRVSLRLSGVRQLRFEEAFHDRGYWLTQCEIEDVSKHQLEGVHFRVTDFEDAGILILCADIEVISCDPMP